MCPGVPISQQQQWRRVTPIFACIDACQGGFLYKIATQILSRLVYLDKKTIISKERVLGTKFYVEHMSQEVILKVSLTY